MARAIEGFDADDFRAGIRLAMEMGRPVDPGAWPEFVIVTREQLAPSEGDADGVPWDPAAPAAVEEFVRLRELCTVEMDPTANDERTWGSLQPGTAVITLLDEEYERVRGFEYVNLWPAGAAAAPVRYHYDRVLEQSNLDVVGVWTLACRTEDQI